MDSYLYMMAIVYTHTRNDNGEIFYIGITDRDEYRPYESKRRNRLWKHIVNETEYTVKIIHQGISLEEAQNIENQLVKEHGRIIYETGTLANILDGGADEWKGSKWKSKIKRLYKKHNIPPYSKPPQKYTSPLLNISVKYTIVKPWPQSHYDKIEKKRLRELRKQRTAQQKEQARIEKYKLKKLTPRQLSFKERVLQETQKKTTHTYRVPLHDYKPNLR